LSAITILVPGAAGATGIDAIKRIRLRHPTARIIATDRDPHAAGFHLADACAVTKPLDTPSALDAVWALMRREAVRFVLPTCRSDTAAYACASAALATIGAVFIGSDAATVALCDDKAAFRAEVAEHVQIAPPVDIGIEGPETYPCFVKPRRGSGGKGAALCRDARDWRAHVTRHSDQMIAETWIPGTEYSVDVFSDFDARPLVAVPRIRLGTWDGVATRIAVIEDLELEALALRLAGFLGLKGASCLQFRRDGTGRTYVQEVNPRLGGASIASALAGVDLVDLSIRLGLGLPLAITRARPMRVFRYLTELAIPTEVEHG
jgi:carbamoyl-phosphate synthase large subunit